MPDIIGTGDYVSIRYNPNRVIYVGKILSADDYDSIWIEIFGIVNNNEQVTPLPNSEKPYTTSVHISVVHKPKNISQEQIENLYALFKLVI